MKKVYKLEPDKGKSQRIPDAKLPLSVGARYPPSVVVGDDRQSIAIHRSSPESWSPELLLRFHYINRIDWIIGYRVEHNLQTSFHFLEVG